MYLNIGALNACIVDAANWTLTWDVFKLQLTCFQHLVFMDWTLTWDVFKYPMGNSKYHKALNWTLTWDVFKLN